MTNITMDFFSSRPQLMGLEPMKMRSNSKSHVPQGSLQIWLCLNDKLKSIMLGIKMTDKGRNKPMILLTNFNCLFAFTFGV